MLSPVRKKQTTDFYKITPMRHWRKYLRLYYPVLGCVFLLWTMGFFALSHTPLNHFARIAVWSVCGTMGTLLINYLQERLTLKRYNFPLIPLFPTQKKSSLRSKGEKRHVG